MIISNFTSRDISFINNSITFDSSNNQVSKSKTNMEIAVLEIFKEVKEMAGNHENLTSRKIKSWQSKLSDNTTVAKPADLETLIQDFNSGLNEIRNSQSILKVVTLISKTIYDFENLLPFEEANGLIGRILGNYVAVDSNLPILVFKPDDKNEYNEAISRDNSEEFTRFIAKKIKEVAYDYMGNICHLVKSNPNSGIYQNPATARKMIVEWHELNRL